MPAIILISGQDKVSVTMPHASLPDVTLRDQYFKGYIVSTYEDVPIGAKETPPMFGVIRIIDKNINRADIEYLRKEWRRDVVSEIVNPAAPIRNQRYRFFVDPLEKSNISLRGSMSVSEINAVLNNSDVVTTGRLVTKDNVTVNMSAVDAVDRDRKSRRIIREMSQTICRRQYRISNALTDTVIQFNNTNQNKPYELSLANFLTQVFDRRSEI